MNVINECNPEIEGEVILGYSGYTSENIFAVVDLLKRALRDYVKTEYHSIVDDIPDLVNTFNARNSEYEKRLGHNIVLEEAERLHLRGWK